MAKEKKSCDMHIELPEGVTRDQMMSLVETASETVGLCISHIGSYSRKKFTNSVHWQFKRDKTENGLIDATFWDVKSLLWLMIRHSEPDWVHKTAPLLRKAMTTEVAKLEAS